MLRVLSCILLTAVGAGAAESYTAKVVAVPGPDVIEVESAAGKEAVRLYGVDAPEQEQAYYDKALAYLEERVKGVEITVEPVATDSQGKTVAKVILPGYVNLNSSLVGEGYAWWDEPNTPEDGIMRKTSAKALVEKKGLWDAETPLAPWDFRKSHGIENFTYSVKPKEEEPKMAANEEEETKELKASGKGQYEEGVYNYNVADMQIDESKFDLNTLMSKHQPRIATDASGNVVGLTATDISQIPYASNFGLQNGDIITGVNGDKITGIGDVMGLIQKNRGAKNLSVNINRGGTPVTINVAIP